MRKNMKKLTVATVIGAMTVTALAPVSAQAKDKTLTVAIWDNGQKAGLQEIMDEFTKETGIKTVKPENPFLVTPAGIAMNCQPA